MYTVFAGSLHLTPVQHQMPTRKDSLGKYTYQYRRDLAQPLHRWEITSPGLQEGLDSLIGLLNKIQGDTPLWTDGGGFTEIVEPRFIGVGDGQRTQFELPHRHVLVSSIVLYVNGSVVSTWTPLGDGITCHAIQLASAPALYDQLTIKYRAKVKVVLETEEVMVVERSFHALTPGKGVFRVKYFLQEVLI